LSRNDDSRNHDRNGRTSEFDDARNELFSHIHRCGVLRATPEQQTEWMKDTVEFLGERFTSLSDEKLNELEVIGMRFCSPVIPHGAGDDAADEGTAAEPVEAGAETEPAAA
jgi:hypothetical protein